MQTVEPGNIIQFDLIFYKDGDYYDPDDIQCYMVRHANQVIAGPFNLDTGAVVQNSTGNYTASFLIQAYSIPAIYSLKVYETTDDVIDISYIHFELVEPDHERSETLDPPIIYGDIKEKYKYGLMGLGTTDHICLIGHADGIPINEPIQVTNMREVVRMLLGDSESPLLRGLLEVYNSGVRDITVVAAAPMGEYVSEISDRFEADPITGLIFYEQYYERLTETYSALAGYDYYDFVVPLEAPFYGAGDTDFLTQLSYFCDNVFASVSKPVLGFIGTRPLPTSVGDTGQFAGTYNESDIGALIADIRFDDPVVGTDGLGNDVTRWQTKGKLGK